MYRMRSNNFQNDFITLAPPMVDGPNVHFGSSLCFSGEGSHLAIGAPRYGNDVGTVFLYNLINMAFEIIVPNPSAGVPGGLLGTTVSINDAGTVVVAGRPCRGCANEHTAGSAVVFTRLTPHTVERHNKYIFVQASTLSVREVAVFIGANNIARYRPAVLAGTFILSGLPLFALNAVDVVGATPAQYLAHNLGGNEWLIIDLGNVSSVITGVTVFNRGDCCQSFAGAFIAIGRYNGAIQWSTFASGTALEYSFTPNV
jgi:hypothetical protein